MRHSGHDDEAVFAEVVHRFGDGVASAPMRAERAVLRGYLQEHIEGVRRTFTAVSDDPDVAVQAKRKALCAELLHPALTQSPFLRRALEKPLGYAGDFEMMNMLYRDPWEGGTTLGRALNVCFTNEPAAVANKNRITYLGELIRRKSRQGPVRIASIGCGPAKEIQVLLRESPELESSLDVTLVDQEQLALDQCARTIPSARLRQVGLRQLVSEGGPAPGESFDLIYSAGLFDYLGPRLFEAVSRGLFGALVPGGELVIGNVATHNPSRWIMEYFADWCLTHRTAEDLAEFGARLGGAKSWVDAEPSGVNLFLHVVKGS